MLKLKYFLSTVALLGAFMLASCDEEPPLPPIDATFDADALGFEGTEASFKVVLSRENDVETPLDITFVATNLVYGTQFTTEPAATDGKIVLTIPAGSTEGVVKVKKPADVKLNGDEKIVFTLAPADPILAGSKTTLNLSFTAITSEGSTLTLNGKTDASNYTNAVYVDLSANAQAAINRKSWNLGFLSGSDFRVILNPGYQTTAAPTAKTDITAVTIADAETVLNLAHDAILTDPATTALADSWDGDLTKTTFGTISATDSENKVFLLSAEGSKEKAQWFKVKVTRNGAGYKVQYARIGETAINTIEVPKNDAYNMTFVSLETKAIVAVEPVKRNWDIEWAYSTGNSGLNTPYWIQDFVLLNYLGGATAAELVSTGGADAAANNAAAAAAYTAYGQAQIATTTFSNKRDVIGTKWRATAVPGGGPGGVRADRFYVIKDPSGNVYKLKFVSFGVPAGTGERGKPVIEYKLVAKAN